MTQLINIDLVAPDGIDIIVIRKNGNRHTFHFMKDDPDINGMTLAQLEGVISQLDDALAQLEQEQNTTTEGAE